MQAKTHSRRDFVKRAALLPFCGAAAFSVSTAEARPPVKRSGGAAFKVSLNAYSFSKLLNDYNLDRGQGISLMALLDFCAKNNFDADRKSTRLNSSHRCI